MAEGRRPELSIARYVAKRERGPRLPQAGAALHSRRNVLIRRTVAAAAFVVALTSSTAAFAGTDYSDTALNIIPSGQYPGIPNPPAATTQAEMYDGLTPLFDNVKPGDLTTYFKSEKLGVDNATPSTIETVPRPGVTIERTEHIISGDRRCAYRVFSSPAQTQYSRAQARR